MGDYLDLATDFKTTPPAMCEVTDIYIKHRTRYQQEEELEEEQQHEQHEQSQQTFSS